MKRLYSYPIASLLMFSVIIVSATSLLSSAVTVWMTSVISGDAKAVNVSGSLRMQAYRMANALAQGNTSVLPNYQSQFERSLYSPELALHISDADSDLLQAFSGVAQQWSELAQLLKDSDLEYLHQVDDFVQVVDRLVIKIEVWSEQKVARLRQLQLFIGVVALFIAMTVVALIFKRLVYPLTLIMQAVGDVARGRLATTIQYQSNDEFGLLSSSFNHMAEQIAQQSQKQLDIIDTQTEELARNYQALSFLFDVSQQLSTNNPDLTSLSDQCLEKLPVIVNAVSICWSQSEMQNAPNTVSVASGRWSLFASFETAPERWQEQVLQTVTELFEQTEQRVLASHAESRLALLDERSVIARELHDSLAQSLSYLKIQVLRWTKLRERGAENTELDAIVIELREGLNSSYRKLRELLVTFRSQNQPPGLLPSLSQLIADIKKIRPPLDIIVNVDPNWPERLTPSQEIHCLHILREALTNVVKHADAEKVVIQLERYQDHLKMTCCDDGIGFQHFDKPMHYGLQIMQERAFKIGGNIAYCPSPQGGACVAVSFPEQLEQEEN